MHAAPFWLRLSALLAAIGLVALGAAGFGCWLLLVLADPAPVPALLTALAGGGLWTLLASLFLFLFGREGRRQPD